MTGIGEEPIGTGRRSADMPDHFRTAPDRGPNLERRRLLVVGAGAVMVGIGTLAGRPGARRASAAHDSSALPAARRAVASGGQSVTRKPHEPARVDAVHDSVP